MKIAIFSILFSLLIPSVSADTGAFDVEGFFDFIQKYSAPSLKKDNAVNPNSPKSKNIKIDGQTIMEVLTVNGVRFSFQDGSWGLIRASSNKPSLVVVTESPTSNERKKKIFDFIDSLLQKTGKIGEYDQKI